MRFRSSLFRQEKQVTHTTTRQEHHHKQTTTRTNSPIPHSTTLKGGAATVRTNPVTLDMYDSMSYRVNQAQHAIRVLVDALQEYVNTST